MTEKLELSSSCRGGNVSDASLGLFLTPNSSLPLSLAQIERNEASERQEEAGSRTSLYSVSVSLQ
jgi:hypothetical protein